MASPEPTNEEEINLTYNANPAVLRQSKEYKPIPPPSAVTFHDKHLDSSLVLKHVEPLPSLVIGLSDLATDLARNIADRDISLPKGHSFLGATWDPEMEDAVTVAKHYVAYISKSCSFLGSTLAFHPTCPKWSTIMCWKMPPAITEIAFAMDGFSLSVRRTEVEPYKLDLSLPLEQFLEDETKQELLELLTAFPHLITGQMFAVTEEAKELLTRLLERPLPKFPWITSCTECSAFSHPTDAKIGGPDSAKLPWLDKKRIQPLACGTEKTRLSKTSRRIIMPSRIGTKRGRRHDDRPIPDQYLQHAWAQSVSQDTTFILFHCGKYDRIGVRHRATQTLYLSDLIDVNTCKDPAYGKLQVGLYVAAVRDARERLSQIKAASNPTTAKAARKKRGRPEDETPPVRNSKRRRRSSVDKVETEVTDEDIMHKIGHRDVALVRLVYGIYNSPVPASFLRCGPSLIYGKGPATAKETRRKAAYGETEYISITLGDEISWGAISVVHHATLSLRMSDGGAFTCQAVAKLAFSKENQECLRHEFSVYAHLSTHKGVKGLLPIYGLFQDMEGGPLMLVLGYGGSSLFSREKERTGKYSDQVNVSESERQAFTDVIRSIHDAGVRHRDIRPHNMLVNGQDVYFIDFDRAQMVATRKGRENEMIRLNRLFEGEFCDGDGRSSYEPSPPGH